MKKLFLIVIPLFLLSFMSEESTHLAKVENVLGVPMFVFSEPTTEYDVIGKAMSFNDMMKMTLDEQSSVREKSEKIVEQTQKRVKKNKIEDFDALLIRIENDKVLAIKFKSEKTDKAQLTDVFDVPVYFFNQPEESYNIVKELEADYSKSAKNGLLFDRINSMVKRTLKKLKNKEVESFDAIIINPDDLSEKLIVYKK